MTELLNPALSGLPLSATLAISERSAALVAKGKEVYRLGLGQSPFPVPEPVVEALRRSAHEKDYLPVRGMPALRAAVAEHHRREDGIEVATDRVLIGPGSKELLFLAQLAYAGDLLLPSPSWVSYAPQARILGRRVTGIDTCFEEGWRIRPDRLEAVCRNSKGAAPPLLILNYPSNPVGNTFQEEELREIAAVARRHRLVVISDEIYGRLTFEGSHRSLAAFYPEGTMVSSGLSKWCGAGGWRLGTFSFPPELEWLLEAMTSVASETYTSVAAPIQHAAIVAFDGGPEIEDYLAHSRRLLSALGHRSAALLAEAGVRVPKPQGGFYLFADFTPNAEELAGRGIQTSPQLAEKLLEDTGVALLPGVPFGRPERELTARLAFVDFDGAKALATSREIPLEEELAEDFLEIHCGRVVEAMRRIAGWIQR